MGRPTSDDQVLRQFLKSAGTRRRRGLLACAIGIAFILFQVWGISLQLERARSYDSILATLTEVDPSSIATVKPIQTSTHISVSIAMHVVNGFLGLVVVIGGIWLLRGWQSHRALEVLARKAILPGEHAA